MRISIAAAALAAVPASADPLWDMCIDPGRQGPEQCDCITQGLQAGLSAPDRALYVAIVRRYLGNLEDGKAEADAWEMALQRESAERRAHYPTFAARVGQMEERHDDLRLRCGG